jgi:hypothetical protein
MRFQATNTSGATRLDITADTQVTASPCRLCSLQS